MGTVVNHDVIKFGVFIGDIGGGTLNSKEKSNIMTVILNK